MKDNKEWSNFTILQKNELFIEFINNEIKNNEENYKDEKIDNLTYTKNRFFLQSLKKNKSFLKKLENNDIIIKNNMIFQIKNIKKNENGLIHFSNNVHKKQLKITDYNYKVVKDYIEYENNDNNLFMKSTNNFENG